MAASINAETDIPLVPSLSGITTCGDAEQNFVIHWLNNKEMHFTSEAENILLEVIAIAPVYIFNFGGIFIYFLDDSSECF